MKFNRDDNSLAAEWWLSIDRVLIGSLIVLIGLGVVLSLAASPALAVRKGLATFHYVERHAAFAVVGALLLLAASTLDLRGVRRVSLVMLLGGLFLMVVAMLTGPEIKGAKRWVHLLGQSLQPSELAKPAFVVLSAWALAEARHRKDVPAFAVAVVLLIVTVGSLLFQPDVGQAVLLTLTWGTMLFVAGWPLRGLAWFAAVAAITAVAAYATFPHVQLRMDRFLWPSGPEGFQTSKALQSFVEGGLFGKGPGEGTLKTVLPDAHTDYVLAVIGEEYGVLACLALLTLFAFVTFRALTRSAKQGDAFARLASAGLASLFAYQVLIHAAVNGGLLPAKGMTLPFISTGGSSILGMSIGMGLLVALTRQRAHDYSLRQSTGR